jgi:predicted alpha/beta-hydrolase family hydrolase
MPAMQARDREGVRQAVEAMRGMVDGAVIAAGHSYGGRQSAMAAAEDAALVNGLALFSYPLHPPKKPEQLRTAFFGDLHVPALFVHGTRDGFGSIEEMRLHIASIPARTDLLAVEGAGHDLKRAPDLIQEILERMLF